MKNIRVLYNKIIRKVIYIFFGRGGITHYESYHYNIKTSNYNNIGTGVILNPPIYGAVTDNIALESYVIIQPGTRFIMNNESKIVIKKFSTVSHECIIVPGSHIPTVTLPQYYILRINNKNSTLIINEDVWVGTNSKLLCGTNIGRGCIVAAGSVVSKPVPPYAVVGGSPAKIFAVRFSLDQIIAHEKSLYPESERLNIEDLTYLFETKYKDLKVIGTSDISDADIELLKRTKASMVIENVDSF